MVRPFTRDLDLLRLDIHCHARLIDDEGPALPQLEHAAFYRMASHALMSQMSAMGALHLALAECVVPHDTPQRQQALGTLAGAVADWFDSLWNGAVRELEGRALDARVFEALAMIGEGAREGARDLAASRREARASHDAAVTWAFYLRRTTYEEFGERLDRTLALIGEKHLWPGARVYFKDETPWASPLATFVTRALWRDQIGPRLERARRNPPGLALPVLSLTQRLTSPATARTVEREGRQLALWDDQGVLGRTDELALAELETLQAVLERGADALQSATGVGLLIGVVIEADRRVHEEQLIGASPILTYEGLEDLALALGLSPNTRAQKLLREALEAGQRLKFKGPGGEAVSGLWSCRVKHEGGTGRGRVGLVTITPADLLLPNYGQRLERHDRLIAPMTPLGELGASKRYHRAEAALHLRLAGELTERSTQIPQEGGVRLEKRHIEELAHNVGGTVRVVEDALERWCSDGDKAPAVLERIGNDRYTYAPNDRYGAARAWLEQTGAMRLDRSKAGQASVVRRAKASKGKRKQ